MQTQVKRLDRIVSLVASARNDVSQNPEVELEIDRLLAVVEVSVQALCDEISEELKE